MKFVEHKQELRNFNCHLSVFNVSPTSDSTHIKTMIPFQPGKLLVPSTRERSSRCSQL